MVNALVVTYLCAVCVFVCYCVCVCVCMCVCVRAYIYIYVCVWGGGGGGKYVCCACLFACVAEARHDMSLGNKIFETRDLVPYLYHVEHGHNCDLTNQKQTVTYSVVINKLKC